MRGFLFTAEMKGLVDALGKRGGFINAMASIVYTRDQDDQ